MPTPAPAEQKKSSLPIRRIISLTILVILIGVFVSLFRHPKPVAEPMAPQAVAANAQSFQQKVQQLSAPASSDTPSSVTFSAAEIQAALIEGARQGTGALPAPGTLAAPAGSASGNAAAGQSTTTPNPQDITLANDAPVVTFEGDVVKGQFHAQVSGRDVIVTVAGHLGSTPDGYVTFEPTEFKIGDVPVPVSLVNDQLQKKMLEQRDQMKLPPEIANIKVENGQLVVTRK